MTHLSVYCAGSLSGLAGEILSSYASSDASSGSLLDFELTPRPAGLLANRIRTDDRPDLVPRASFAVLEKLAAEGFETTPRPWVRNSLELLFPRDGRRTSGSAGFSTRRPETRERNVRLGLKPLPSVIGKVG